MPNVAFLNGRFLPLAQAKVSVEDRGFQFGDGVYEVIRTYSRKFFEVETHLERLERSAVAIGLNLVYSYSRWKRILEEMNRRCGYKEAKIYIQITRGVAPRDHIFPVKTKITVVVTARKLVPPPPRYRLRGISIVTIPDIRWNRCDIKAINLLPNVMARQVARNEGAYEALFIRRGYVTEGAVSNVFALIKSRLVTPLVGPNILSGITRNCILKLAKDMGLPIEERDVAYKELQTAQEVFLTGTTLEVLPVVRVDNQLIGDGRPGKTTKQLARLFHNLTRR